MWKKICSWKTSCDCQTPEIHVEHSKKRRLARTKINWKSKHFFNLPQKSLSPRNLSKHLWLSTFHYISFGTTLPTWDRVFPENLHVETMWKARESEIERLRQLFENKNAFVVIDETELNKVKYVNVLIGDITVPEKTYLLDCWEVETVNHQVIAPKIDDALQSINIPREKLLSDAASYMYMTAATAALKTLYPNLFRVTCVAHMLHNCSEKIRAYYTDVDQLIAWTKAATVKNKTRRNKFGRRRYAARTRSYKMEYMAGSSKLLCWKFGTSPAHRQLIWEEWDSRAESQECCQWRGSGKIIDCNPERLLKHSEDDQESRIIKVYNAGSVQGHYQGWLQVWRCWHHAISKKRIEKMLMWRPSWKMRARTSTQVCMDSCKTVNQHQQQRSGPSVC